MPSSTRCATTTGGRGAASNALRATSKGEANSVHAAMPVTSGQDEQDLKYS